MEIFNSRLKQTPDRISELEDRSFEIIQSEKQKDKRMKKSEESLKNNKVKERRGGNIFLIIN